MKTDVSADARATLAAVDTALRRAGDLHWSDPEFLAWEAGQVGELEPIDPPIDQPDGIVAYATGPGPARERTTYGVTVRPMATIHDDHRRDCECETGPTRWRHPYRLFDWEYPPPEDTTQGPLLLGPEPDVVLPDTRGHVLPEPVVQSPRRGAQIGGRVTYEGVCDCDPCTSVEVTVEQSYPDEYSYDVHLRHAAPAITVACLDCHTTRQATDGHPIRIHETPVSAAAAVGREAS